ncbi:MAG: four helix bundle protein [Candidatus Raymondbacteria bacterium RifOxyA12_full_50_37]|uniref:Four helix bundle protein n=1 Tax=Candidatus Raymondbacteria bacterium RIFOXYD12_FULL_49_13 TaxID=1817890 RepID=A0A1F7F769_UNCRA|nr:MAG: four helix bundle protein [Candidatus Raymondbacteria bacterium RifOxyA12_full_50_37]OGJ88473.1 MAG: four helix bundle protein [Candidatus Raymondbacteria bacterium RIFOXYA2_FULL_49_16]OGJ90644.1 MAG: four helix bundle protein [Candidatus Raymondbacteria bacterium RifOxyB12_full_50_8]OGJ98933.1 MAG: four helix bundle protein [Candidatus Raymondbacteria bacterium RIFOXYC2_FULL_50_21]OGK02367.1 MAG: four helix bundle protein [Candidatus Raymondbacteria bacterium RIFOXYD12_FULL_49_13]OGK0
MQFEDLVVWKRAVKISAELYKELKHLKDYSFRDQITRSGLSIPSNIAEGFERGMTKECVHFLAYAKGSCGELFTQIMIGKEAGYIPEKQCERWVQETKEIAAMLGSLMKTRSRFAQEKRYI